MLQMTIILFITCTVQSRNLPERQNIQNSNGRYNISNDSSKVMQSFNLNRIQKSPIYRSSDSLTKKVQNSLLHDLKDKSSDSANKSGIKRGVDIGVHLRIPTTKKYVSSLERLEDVLAKAFEGRLEEEISNKSGCLTCEEEDDSRVLTKRIVKPAYHCDEWDATYRICILERNIGDTVTFYLSTGSHTKRRSNITWMKEFHIKTTNTRKEIAIDPENSPENIIIGRRGYELRVSPITEIDVGYNLFSATIKGYTSSLSKVLFMIRIVPVDLGFIYVGETIELNLRSFVSLPAESINFKWYMERDGERGTLPSNMKVSGSGSSIKISELRQEQEGILACSVYTNRKFLATKKRFLLKDLFKNNDVLKSSPNHNLLFKELYDREKRYHQTVIKRSKRDADMDDIIEKALLEPTVSEEANATQQEAKRPNEDYNLDFDLGHEEPEVKNFNNDQLISEYNENGYQNFDKNLNGHEQLSKTKQLDITVDNNPVEVEESQETLNQVSPNNEFDKQKSTDTESSQQYQKPQPGYTSGNNRKQDIDIQDMESKKNGNYRLQDNSEIVLNIDKFAGKKRFTAEEIIAKLISFCYSDFECSGNAICVRRNLKTPGFCKCMTGFNGVGIFCREDTWISLSLKMDSLQSSGELSYSSESASEQQSN